MPKYMFSDEFLQNVIDFYKQHSLMETKEKFGISTQVIERILRNAKVEKHKKFAKRIINEGDKKFIIENYDFLSDTAIARELHIHLPHLREIYIELNLKPRTHQENVLLGQKKQQLTCLEKYGVPFTSQSQIVREKLSNSIKKVRQENGEEIKRKTKETCLRKYGCEYSLQSEVVKSKGRKTCLEKYGVDTYMKTDTFKTKSKQYTLEHKEEINRKIEETSMLKYGTKWPSQSEIIKNKIKESNFNKYGSWYSQTEERLQKMNAKKEQTFEKYKKTILNKYGTENYFETDEFKAKLYITKKKNKSFNSSKIEKEFYEKLLLIFEKEDVFKQYKEERYPFACDFYIKSLDLFIELNLHWSHGFMPFSKRKKECIEKLNLWQEKSVNSEYYRLAIITWTQRDVKKRKTAKANKLNYSMLYSYEEIEPYLNKLKKQKKYIK